MICDLLVTIILKKLDMYCLDLVNDLRSIYWHRKKGKSLPLIIFFSGFVLMVHVGDGILVRDYCNFPHNLKLNNKTYFKKVNAQISSFYFSIFFKSSQSCFFSGHWFMVGLLRPSWLFNSSLINNLCFTTADISQTPGTISA